MSARPDGLGHEKKLSDKDIAEIRKLYEERCSGCGRKKWTQRDLAAMFKVTAPLINAVIHGKRHFSKK